MLTLTATAEDVSYVVKPKDTLYGLARKHGVSVAKLAERNHLDRNAKLYVGQRLRIPTSQKASGSRTPPGLNQAVQTAIESAKVKSSRWKYIVVHHSGVPEGTMKGMDRYHREERHMENGLAYHFVIGNGNGMKDGEIGVGARWKQQLNGGHLRSTAQNQVALGICLVGNFDKTSPTPKQMASLEALTRALMKRCNLKASAVRSHKQINVVGTRCPGRKFSINALVSKLD